MGAVGKSKEEWREMDEWLLPLGLGYDGGDE